MARCARPRPARWLASVRTQNFFNAARDSRRESTGCGRPVTTSRRRGTAFQPRRGARHLRGITLPPEYVGRSLGSVGRQPTAAARAAAPSSGCRHQRRRTPTRTRRSRTRTPAASAGWRSRPTRGGGHGGHGQRCCSGSSATAARASVGSTSSACPSLQWTATATGSALLALPLPTRRMTRATCSRRMCTRDAVAQRASEQTCAWLSVRRTIHLSSIVLVQYTCCRTKVALLMMSRHRGSVEARHGRTLSKGASVASSQVQNLRCDC